MPSTTAAVLVRYEDPLDVRERGAVAGFLAGYTGSTRVSYTTDLRLFASWCDETRVRLLDVKRAHLELFARQMEADGRMRSTVARRISTLASFYRYCHIEGILERNPAANVRRPKVDYESRTLGLDRNELGGLLVQAGLGSARDQALISIQRAQFVPVKFDTIMDKTTGRMKVRMVDVASDNFKIARSYMDRLDAADFADEAKLAKLAKVAKLEPEAFQKAFGHLAT